MIKPRIDIEYTCPSSVKPSWNTYLLDSNRNKISESCIISDRSETTALLEASIDDSIDTEYTLVLELYASEIEGIDICNLCINDIDLNDLIHRRSHVYANCTDDPNYILQLINDERFSVHMLPHEVNKEQKNYRLLSYRHNKITGNTPKVFNNRTNEFTEYTGYLLTDNNYVIKGTELYYDCTDDLCFIVKHTNNENLYVEGELYVPEHIYLGGVYEPKFTYTGSGKAENLLNFIHNKKLIHHIPNSSCLSMPGRWEFKFRTPLYSWITDNIFGDDLT